ncbi:MAG: hypothetical protein WCW93_01400 [Candidatus Paceibacterota bacterium]
MEFKQSIKKEEKTKFIIADNGFERAIGPAEEIKNRYTFYRDKDYPAELRLNGNLLYDEYKPITIEEDSIIYDNAGLSNYVLRKGDLIVVTKDGKQPDGENWNLINEESVKGIKTAVWVKKNKLH